MGFDRQRGLAQSVGFGVGIMKIGDLVKHKYINKIGVIHKVWMNYHFVQWADGSRQQHHQRDLRAVKKCP